MDKRSQNFENSPSEEIRRIIDEGLEAILPLGAVEDHGPHLPTGTDNFICEKIASIISEKTGAIILPCIRYSYVWSLGDRVGSISLSFDTLRKTIYEVALELYRQGFRTLIMLDAHIGNSPVAKTAARDITAIHPDMKCMYFTYLDSVNHVDVFESPRASGRYIHACEIETSAMLYSKPELVDMGKAIRNYPSFPEASKYTNMRWSEFTTVAVLGDATCAAEEKGRALLERAAEEIADIIIKERNRKDD